MWAHLKRVIKKNGAIVLTASQPFTTTLISSNMGMFRYDLVWDKVNKYTGALNANRMPLRRHETILIWYASLPTFNKQLRPGKPYKTVRNTGHGRHTQYGRIAEKRIGVNTGSHNPCSVICIKGQMGNSETIHPTQKPVALMEYLIKTYTNEGETVLDFCMGSGTTGVACSNLNRSFIGIEKDTAYFEIAKDRIDNQTKQLNLFHKDTEPS